MNSKFKRTRIAALLLIASGTANTVCAQSYTPTGSQQSQQQYGAPQNGMLVPRSPGNLPPIVSGSQSQTQQSVRRTPANLPPIVSGSQSRLMPPIVSGAQHAVQPSASRPVSNNTQPGTNGQVNPLRPIQVPQIMGSSQVQSNAPATPMNKPSGLPNTALPQAKNGLQSGQVLSASGVPYYSSGETKSLPRMRVEQPNFSGSSLRPSRVQDSSAGSVAEGVVSGQASQPAARQPNMQAAQQPAARNTAPREGMSSVMAPRTEQDGGMLPGESSLRATEGRVSPREMGTREMGTREMGTREMGTREMGAREMGAREVGQGVLGAQNYFDMAPGQSEFTPGCQDCVAAGGTSNCPTCSPNTSYATGGSGIDSTSGYFGAMSRARRYAELDLLYLTRNDGSIVFSNFGGLGNFDGNVGWRFTLGQRSDETQGKEFSYFGTSDITAEANRIDAGSRLSALFSPAGVIDSSLTQPFFDARIQNERMETSVHSVEFNRVRWAWDVVKSFVGFRYIHVDDAYSLFSQRGVDTADYEIRSFNNLVGVHIGRELFYDIGYRVSFSALAKGGIYANANRFNVNVANNGVPFISNRNDSSAFSTSLELMLTGHYQINRRARVRMGYQAMLLDDVYSISDNLTGTLSPFFGSREADKDSMFFHGVNIGLEFYR